MPHSGRRVLPSKPEASWRCRASFTTAPVGLPQEIWTWRDVISHARYEKPDWRFAIAYNAALQAATAALATSGYRASREIATNQAASRNE